MKAIDSLLHVLPRVASWPCVLVAIACSRGETGPTDAKAPSPGAAAVPAEKPAAEDFATRAAAARAAPPKTNDVFALEPNRLELGVLDPDEHRTVEFKLRNLGSAPLKIMIVKTACKCVTLDYSKAAIAGGESTTIHVSVVGVTNSLRRLPVTVMTDDPKRSTAEIVVTYAVVPELVLVPPKLDFGKANVGDHAEQTILVTMHLPAEIETVPVLEPFMQHDLPIRLTLDPPTVTPTTLGFRDVTTTLHALLDTSKPLASFRSDVVFKPRVAKTYRYTSVAAFGEVRAGTFFEVDKLVFLAAAVGTPVTKSVRLHYQGEQAPALADVVVEPADFSEKHEVDAAGHCIRFDVTCTARAAPPLDGELRVKLRATDAPLTVKLTARGR